jgi:hypothetical protein
LLTVSGTPPPQRCPAVGSDVMTALGEAASACPVMGVEWRLKSAIDFSLPPPFEIVFLKRRSSSHVRAYPQP